MAGNGHDDSDDLTPPEAYPLTHPGNREPCRVLADLTLRIYERTRKLEALRHEIAADPRPVGREGWPASQTTSTATRPTASTRRRESGAR